MNSLTEFLANALIWKVLAAYWIFNATADSLPQPNGNKWYEFFYKLIHKLAGNLDRAAQKFNVPGSEASGVFQKTP